MNWFDVLKTSGYIRGRHYSTSPSIDNWEETANAVAEKLERALNEDGFEPEGEWVEELDGYRDATDSVHLSGMIESRPEMEHEEHDDITTEFDLYYNGLRVANYTGTQGIWITYDDWSKHEWVELVELERELDEWLKRG